MPTRIVPVAQPNEAANWDKVAEVRVERAGEDFRGVMEAPDGGCGEVRRTETFSARTPALKKAFEYCNSRKLRVRMVSGVRSEKYRLV